MKGWIILLGMENVNNLSPPENYLIKLINPFVAKFSGVRISANTLALKTYSG